MVVIFFSITSKKKSQGKIKNFDLNETRFIEPLLEKFNYNFEINNKI